MATGATEVRPNAATIFETLNSYQRSAALKTAIELDLFTIVADGAATAAEIGARAQAAERGIRILCDYLTIHRLLAKNGDRYSVTPDSGLFLNRRSPAYLGTTAAFLLTDGVVENFKNLTARVRDGGMPEGESTVQPDNEIWVTFARSMAPMMVMPAEAIAALVTAGGARPIKVLDIAAGHGLFGIAIARHNPEAEITALDWAAVLEVAKENAKNAGVSKRYRTIPGSAFEADFGEGYDVVLLTNFLHHFDPSGCETLLRKVHAALKPDGRVVTLEFVPNEDRISPPIPASFSLLMLAGTPSGDAYTFPQLDQMFRNAGFSRNTIHPIPDFPQSIIVSEK